MGGKGDEMLDRSSSAKAACKGCLASGGAQGCTAVPFTEANSAVSGWATPGFPSVARTSSGIWATRVVSDSPLACRTWPSQSRQSRLTAAPQLLSEDEKSPDIWIPIRFPPEGSPRVEG